MKNTEFDTPILLIIFNKPETTRSVFKEISDIRPKQLYIFCDGPRNIVDTDDQLLFETKQIVSNINWPCKFYTNYLQLNLGVAKAVYTAITWFFEHVDIGIILEADCLPCQDFFYFCQELLSYYKSNHNIWHISGDNHQRGHMRGKSSYYFSKIPHIWGWATWKRAWQFYNPNMSDFEIIIKDKEFINSFNSKKEYITWSEIFRKTYLGQIDTWDFQWSYAMRKNKALAIIPNMNLVSNIGFGPDALHCKNVNSPFANIPVEKIGELSHPDIVQVNYKADKFTFKNNFYVKIKLLSRIKHFLIKLYKIAKGQHVSSCYF